MVLIRILKSWEIPEHQTTPETAFLSRRRFLKTAIAAGIGATVLPIAGCNSETNSDSLSELIQNTTPLANIPHNPNFIEGDRPITDQSFASRYNNFYEFGGTKSIWKSAQSLPTEDWKIEVGGLVKNPRIYDIDEIQTQFPLEERIYRFRCVEAWAMVVPWIGFPMKRLIEAVEPTSAAKFVRFTSFYDPEITPGPGFHLGTLPWPYTESLRIEEMANELAFFATGIYGRTLPKQHGAPLRMVIPWKYGFKGAKSIVKIEFLAEQPPTYWNTLVPSEYDFEANVNPNKPHPRWSQATERIVGDGPAISWERQPTLPYNGYGEWVANLYSI